MKQAIELAAQHQARIDVFHVVTIDRDDPAHLEQAIERYMDKVEKEVFADLETRTELIRTRGVSVGISTSRSLSPQEAIVDRVNETLPDLVVMGTHGRSGLGKLFLGSVAEYVVRHAPCHVMTVGVGATVAESERGFDPILVPVDFTEYSRKAIDVARGLLSADGRLILLHVVSSPIHPSFYAGGVTRLFQLDPDLPNRIREKLRSLYKGPGELVVTEGNVVENVLDTAVDQKARMIVMGTRGLSGLEHALVGSVTERVLGRAAIPVVAVK
jgi:nucleotide-binding universal stress UspA family protein